MKQKKLLNVSVFMAFAFVFCVLCMKGNLIHAAEQKAKGINVMTPTQEEIKNRLSGLEDKKSTYAKTPVFTAPYDAGKLSDETLQNALDWMNAVRFIAGIPDNVTLNNEYVNYAQASSIVNLANDKLSHYPEKPAGIDEDLYNLGYEGSGKSNIAYGGGYFYRDGMSFYTTIVHGWMEDSDQSNIARVGHRRWILNPSMTQTGFGAVWDDGGKYEGRQYSAMYAMDNPFGSTEYYGVAWPAQNMPIHLFGSNYAWSVSMGKEVSSDAVVTLTRVSDGKVWTFKNGSTDYYIENNGYGRVGCIIFRPDGISSYNHGDTFKVVIKGTNLDVEYYVNFFDVDKVGDKTTSTPTPEPTKKVTPEPTPEVTPNPTKEVTPEPTPETTPTDAPKVSMTSEKFTFTDIRSNKEVTFKANDGVPKVLLLGGIGSCGNTISAMKSFDSLMPKIDGEFKFYALDIKGNSVESMVSWLNDNNIGTDQLCASVNNISGSSYYKLYQYGTAAIEKNGGNWLMPMVLYVDGDGYVVSATVCYKSPSDIEKELSKIVKFVKEPTPEPTKEPTPEPTKEPTPEPTKEPTPEPTKEPTPEPTKEPTPEPTKEPTPEPTEEPTPEPTEEPTPEPTKEPTPEPTPVVSANGEFSTTTFEMTDALTGSKVTFDGGNGKAKILLFGDLSTCWNTLDMVDSFGYAMANDEYDLEIYLIDTKNSSDSRLSQWIGQAYVNDSMAASAEKKVKSKNGMSVSDIKKAVLQAAGVSTKGKRLNFVSPAVAYIDKNGDIVNATTGYVEYQDVVPAMNYLVGKDNDTTGKRAGHTSALIEDITKNDGSVIQKVLKTDARGGQSIDVYKVNKKGKKENTSYTVTGKNTLTLMSTVSDLTKLSVPSYVVIGNKKYYVTAIDQPGNPLISKITQVTIGKKVRKIKKDAFKSVEKLSVVNITAGKLKSVAKGAFSMTDENTVFNIKGTKAQFEKVKKMLIASGVSENAVFNKT